MENPRYHNEYGWRSSNPGRVLSNALRRFEDRVMQLMVTAGYAETRRTHVNLTRHLDLEGTRITDLAKRAAMTNAAMSELIDQCVVLGLVARAADPKDKRARIVQFTSKGYLWLSAFGRSVNQAEDEMAQLMGVQMMPAVLDSLASYAAGTDKTETEPA
jgi:predicted transcriptional regulator